MRTAIQSLSHNAALALLALLLAIAADARAVTINWVPVGNPGNAPDQLFPDRSNPDNLQFGAVAYNYNIDKYDVTVSQYAELLNAKDPTGANVLSMYNSNMAPGLQRGGITYSPGAANGQKYSVPVGGGNRPVNYVTWYDAIRFANWLNNGQGNGATETGAYTIGAVDASGIPINDVITRNSGATVFLPSENEWYKAAYYNPTTQSYYKYGTSSNTAPTAGPPTGAINSANYQFITQDITNVGAYSGTTSPYGAYDMSGNVYQWNESLIGSERGKRGGGYFGSDSDLSSSVRTFGEDPNTGQSFIGFRVASLVPEPSSVLLAAFGFAGLAAWGLRRRK